MGQLILVKTMSLIIKRKGHTEEFDQKKLYASIYSSCVALRETSEQAELIAQTVTNEVVHEFSNQQTTTSKQVKEKAYAVLNTYHPEAALIYKTHLDLG